MKTNRFFTREKVRDRERQSRDHLIARNAGIAQTESILKDAGREDLLGFVAEATEIGEEYSPPNASELVAIEVGDVVRLCTYTRYPGYGFDWNPLVVLKISGDEIHGLLSGGFLDEDERVTVSLECVCSIDDHSPNVDQDVLAEPR